MGSGAMIHTPSFIQTGSGIQKLMEVGTQHGNRVKPTLGKQAKKFEN
jgi:hypothetical protein